MDLHVIFTSMLMFALLIVFIFRQLQPRQPTRLRFYIMPVIAIIVAYERLPRPIVPEIQIIEGILSVIIGIGFGVLQARYTKVYHVNGEWLMKGDWKYLLTWLGLFAMRMIIMVVFNHIDHGKSMVVEWIIWAEIAVVWGVRSLLLMLRYPQLRSVLARPKNE
ncbi:hypothetical protein GCM10011391_22960 [Pullulanibacillus camelliae]|uniref:DUF1453 family protein n=1 Tax=Pullulanibacillus camelliae TaxID=1707096 RepID=A0A8J3DWE0_9BACL|nr:hypothetical protein [Pullulanibacillus camelliae]GGE43608.1 hypothetical protein GCM10011391_22960 [Pullulanibacillus camelliae]